MPSTPTAGTRSGIITSTTGDRHIPSSTRADGSTRKEIKIRPGYKPPEDIEVYKNRTAEAWKTRGTRVGVPGAALEEDDTTKASGNKNAKRREARKRAKAAGQAEQDVMDGDPTTSLSDRKAQAGEDMGPANGEKESQTNGDEPLIEREAEKEKKVRNLRKKLRQARELREKKDKGGNLLPEQFEKVIKINELIRQLDALGFDANGEQTQG
ncbi:MAG: hypothetical protein LQ342_001550 [Letrouitia transgressa]|nr:MAG: hypothetical protein LQ342_001550 [Letrouitia transgressa]